MSDNKERQLIFDVLDRLAAKAGLHSSSLVYLNHDFSTKEIDQINQFMMTQTVDEQVVSQKALGRLLVAVKPELSVDQSQAIAKELMPAWLEEGMFKPILD